MGVSASLGRSLGLRRRHGLGVGAFAVLDQVLFAGSSFSINILLARWLPPVQYGAFALAFFLFLLLGALHTAVLTEPMLVFGASVYRGRVRAYLGRHVMLHVLVSVATAIVLAVGAGVVWLSGSTAWPALLALAAAAPFVLLLWLLRRAFYIELTPRGAVAGDAVYFAATLAGLYLLHRTGHLSPENALFVMGAAAAAGSCLMLAVLRPDLRGAGVSWREIASRHWVYGRWSTLAQALYWASGQVLVILVPVVLGLGALAGLAAAMNLFRPLNPLLQSVQTVMLPSTASAASDGAGTVELRRRLRGYLLVAGGGVFLYGLTLSIFSHAALHALYRGRYDDHRSLVFLFALSYTVSTVVQVQTVLLKATGNVRVVPAIWALSGALVLVCSVPAMLVFGLTGALIVLIASYSTAALVAWRRAQSMDVRFA
jgi:O-antigen/teichoic acid export membrane protein